MDLSGKPTLPQLLEQLRGATVTVHAPNAITGRIVSVEKREQVVGDPPTKIQQHLLTLASDDGLQTVVLERVDRVQLADKGLQSELNKALTTLAGGATCSAGRWSCALKARASDRCALAI